MTFYLWAVIGFIIFLITIFALPKSRFFQPIHTPVKKDLLGYMQHLKNPALLLLFGLGIILQLSFTGIWTYLPFHLDQAPYNLSAQDIGYLFFAYIFCVFVPSISCSLANFYCSITLRY